MAVVLLFWDSNMAAVTSCEYTLLLLLLSRRRRRRRRRRRC